MGARASDHAGRNMSGADLLYELSCAPDKLPLVESGSELWGQQAGHFYIYDHIYEDHHGADRATVSSSRPSTRTVYEEVVTRQICVFRKTHLFGIDVDVVL